MDPLRKGIAIGMLFGSGGTDAELHDKEIEIETSDIRESQTAIFEYDPADEDPSGDPPGPWDGYSLFTIDLSNVQEDLEDLEEQLEACHDCKDAVVDAMKEIDPDYELPESGCPDDIPQKAYDVGYDDGYEDGTDEGESDPEHDPTENPGIEVPPGVDPQDVIDALDEIGIPVKPVPISYPRITTNPGTTPPETVDISVFFAGYMYGKSGEIIYKTTNDSGYKGYASILGNNVNVIADFNPWATFVPNSRTYIGPVLGIKIAGNKPIYNYNWAGIYFPPEAEVVGVDSVSIYPYSAQPNTTIEVTLKHKGVMQDPWTLQFSINIGTFNTPIGVTTYIQNT